VAISGCGGLDRDLRTLFDVGSVAGMADGALLDRFVGGSGEAAELAFAALVERHGSMVARVCRGVLRDRHDAEDALQATFLVLARRAGSIRRVDSVASWLHGVALRVAARSRAAGLRRRAVERRQGVGPSVVEPATAVDDLARAIHEELGRLPGRFRDAAVLCLLEGRTHEEAAARLGCPVGTVKSRLSTARRTLRDRLDRRGIAPAVTALAVATALGEEARAAALAVPSALAEGLVRAAVEVSRGEAAGPAGVVPAGVVALTQGVLTTMWIEKAKVVSASLALALTCGLGIAWAQQGPNQGAGPGQAAPEADRLREVERKLDRVLEALAGRQFQVAPAVAPASASPGLARGANDVRAVGSAETPHAASASHPTAAPAPVAPAGVAPTILPGTTDQFIVNPKIQETPVNTRLYDIERRLADVVRRLEQCEQRLDVIQGKANGSSSGRRR